MFLKRFFPEKFLFMKRSCNRFIPKIEQFLKVHWSMNQHLYYQFLQRKHGDIVLIFPEMVNMRKNDKCDY